MVLQAGAVILLIFTLANAQFVDFAEDEPIIEPVILDRSTLEHSEKIKSHHHKVTVPSWLFSLVIVGSSLALVICLGCLCYYVFIRKPDDPFNRRSRSNYEEKNGPIDLEMIQLQRKKNVEDGTFGSSLSDSEIEAENY